MQWTTTAVVIVNYGFLIQGFYEYYQMFWRHFKENVRNHFS